MVLLKAGKEAGGKQMIKVVSNQRKYKGLYKNEQGQDLDVEYTVCWFHGNTGEVMSIPCMFDHAI